MSEISSVPDLQEMEVQAVVDFAKEIVEKNKTVKMEQLFNVAKKRLKLNDLGLKRILKYLFDNKILIEGSKIIKSEVLSNEIRGMIFNFVKIYPGINFSALRNNLFKEFDKNDTNIGTGQIIWHLEVLLKFKCLKKVEYKNYTLYSPYNMDTEQVIYYFLLRDKINRKVIDALIENEPLKQADIPKIINELKGSVYYHLEIMKTEKILKSEKKQDAGAIEVCIESNKKSSIMEIYNDIENKLQKLNEKSKVQKLETKEAISEQNIKHETIEEINEKEKIPIIKSNGVIEKEPGKEEKPIKKEKKEESKEKIKIM